MEDKKHIQDALSQASQTSSSQAAPSPRTLTENMASSPDRLQDFDLKKQDLWLEHSNAIIEELSHSLPDYPQQKPVLRKDIRCPEEVLLTQAGCAYAFLASKRRDIAKLLKQGPLRYQFGLFNKPGFVSTDDFNLVKHLPNQKETIYQQLTALISETPADVDIHRQMDEATNGIIYTIKIKMASDKLKRQHEENLKSPIPFIDDDDTDLTITFQDYGLDNPKTAIQIDHHPTPFAKNYSNDSSYFYVQFILIEPYVRACLAWSSDKGIHEFLKMQAAWHTPWPICSPWDEVTRPLWSG